MSNTKKQVKRRKSTTKHVRDEWNIGPDYKFIKSLGTGSYGKVCLAEHVQTKEKVAIKHVKGIFQDVIECKKLLREIYIMSYVNHPNIVKLLKIIRPQRLTNFNDLYIVMEYVQSDLKKLCSSMVFLEEDQIQAIAYNILCALRYLHSANILHRDLKPGNILLNDDCEVKICDFGLSRTLQQPQQRHHSEFTSSFLQFQSQSIQVYQQAQVQRPMTAHVVTRWYRPPELILQNSTYGKPIDVWSTGCVIAELLQLQRENEPSYMNRKPLFPGSSCYPLSPNSRKKGKIGKAAKKSDQLSVIFDIIGSPSEEDIETVENPGLQKYLQEKPKVRGRSFSSIFPGSNSGILQILEQMLVFNPNRRADFDECLNSPYFDNIRDYSKEIIASSPALFEFEEIDCISISSLREYLISLINNYY